MSVIKVIGGIVAAVLALGSIAITFFLFSVGSSNNWTSDGPGMLLVYLGIGLFGLATFFFGYVALAIFSHRS